MQSASFSFPGGKVILVEFCIIITIIVRCPPCKNIFDVAVYSCMIYYYVNVPTITWWPGGSSSGIMAGQTSAVSQSVSGLG